MEKKIGNFEASSTGARIDKFASEFEKNGESIKEKLTTHQKTVVNEM